MLLSGFALLAIVHLLLMAAQVAATFDCAKKFWPSLEPGASCTVNARCQSFEGYPRTFGKTKVSVAYTENWGKFAHVNRLFEKVAPVLNEGLAKSIEPYGTIAKVPLETVVILTADTSKPQYLETWFPIEEEQLCQVKAIRKWTTWVGSHQAWAKQALAHELYHCVQQYKLGPGP